MHSTQVSSKNNSRKNTCFAKQFAVPPGVSKTKTYENEDRRPKMGLRNYENEDPSLFSYYENEDPLRKRRPIFVFVLRKRRQ
jgi:hypothetical protein